MKSSVSDAKTSERILCVAERVFLTSGFHRVLMDDLARELGMSKKTLYAHFDSKEALLRAVLHHRLSRIDTKIKALVSVDGSFPAKFEKLTHFLHVTMAEVSPALLEDVRRYAPECFKIVEQFRGQAIPLYFGALVEEGIREGYLRPDIDRNVLIRMLVLSIQGIIRPEVVSELRMHPSAIMEQILSIILHGIVNPPRKAQKKSSHS